MDSSFQLLPEQASTTAAHLDHLTVYLLIVATIFSVLIFALIFFFAIRYRRRSEHERVVEVKGALTLEIVWTVLPFLLMMVMFVWGASVFIEMSRPPDDAMNIYVVGKQWMWKTAAPGGPARNQ